MPRWKWLAALLVAALLLTATWRGDSHDVSLPQQFFGLLLAVAEWAQTHGPVGILALGAAITVTSMTPLPGYGALLLICGFSFGYPGFLLGYTAALLGGVLGFVLGRHFLRDCILAWVQANEKFQMADQVISQGRLWSLLLFRLAPYPFPLVTYILAVSGVDFKRYLLATALALPKQLVHITIGKSLKSLQEVFAKGIGRSWTLVFFSGSVLISLTLAVTVAVSFRQAKFQKEQPEPMREEELAVSGNPDAPWMTARASREPRPGPPKREALV